MEKNTFFYEQKHASDVMSLKEKAACQVYCAEYMSFLNVAKTEREAVKNAVILAEKVGFKQFQRGMKVKEGDRLYRTMGGKAVIFAVVGKKKLDEGVNVAAAHVDAPRLDLKQVPLYEDSSMALCKTHYYGGIRKYQWVAIPLALHGVIALKNGNTMDICIGEEESDPVFYITDLLPHLAADQNKKTLADGITGEGLNVMVGTTPDSELSGSNRVKSAVLNLLHDKYGICEEDLISSELEIVPAMKARDVGLDRSLIGAYGHDDRVCAYAELKAILELDVPEKTAVCILADKEEVGSDSVSGMQSEAFECFVEDLCDCQNVKLRHCLERSFCISADVTAAYDPNFAEVYEKRNSAKINLGVGLMKFTGSRGKGGSNDAPAEVVARVRRMLDDANVMWQMCELGKVDQGGGGTVARFMSKRNINTIDAGVPVLSMHSPYELVSKSDCYMTYLAMKALFAEK